MSAYNHSKPPLPEDWTPAEDDVVVGKGKKFYLHPGNIKLRTLVASMLAEYSKANTKAGKSEIISDVVDHVNQKGAFVKRHPVTGKWVYAEDRLCREKCSQTFRDSLHETYRSSSVAKKNKRRREQEESMYEPNTVPSIEAIAQQETKRRRTMEEAAPISIPSNFFDLDMTSNTTLSTPAMRRASLKAIRRASIASGAGNNFVSVLTDMLTLPFFDDDDGNPFEPTPLPNLQFDGKFDPASIFGAIDSPSSFLGSKDEEFSPLSCESGTGANNRAWFNNNESRKVPSFAAAFAA